MAVPLQPPSSAGDYWLAPEQKGRSFPVFTLVFRNQSGLISTLRNQTLDADHGGRIERRNYTVIHDVGWLQARHPSTSKTAR
jgi:hypothetical protein